MTHKKFGGFKTREYAVIAMFAAFMVLIDIIVHFAGANVPMVLFIFFINPLFAVLVILVIRKPGAIILGALLASTIALPTPAFGIPGLAKYPVLISAAIAMEIAFFILRNRERLASIISGGALVVGNTLSFYYVATYLGFPFLLGDMLLIFSLVGFIVGAIGGYCGYILYKRIENKPLIKQMQA